MRHKSASVQIYDLERNQPEVQPEDLGIVQGFRDFQESNLRSSRKIAKSST